ncbi:MAG TPA: hypothetical protein VE398_11730 [Acidobacteriota bacterium]|nr:hypothetical protein [Acidobacteriota bacterium]
MKIPKFWANETQSVQGQGGKAYRLSCWQWSDNSAEEAKRLARERAQELVRKVQNGWALDRYSYGERPVREEIKEVISAGDRKEVGVITRNRYGALVLNSAYAMFIDIDFDEGARTENPQNAPQMPELAGLADGLISGIKSLFGTKQQMPGVGTSPAAAPQPSPADRQLRRIEETAARYPDLDLRVYRTFAGLRCLITNQIFDPASADTAELMRSLGSDPLYMRLCRQQECFRARLTAKPWRCGADRPPFQYPWPAGRQEAIYRQWEQRYSAISQRFTACSFVKLIGRGKIHPDLEPVLAFHDRVACSHPGVQLA